MPVTHEPWLVVLSLAVAIQGAYVGLRLSVQVGTAEGLRRRLLIAGAAVSLSVAIWAMHFIGMLAVRLPFPVDYLVLQTLLSFLVCVLVVGVGVFAVNTGPRTPGRVAAAAWFMGGGIVSMHYIGMTALHASAHVVHAPLAIAASIVIAVAASGFALWLAGGRSDRPLLFLPAIAFGLAITGMHYTAMAGVTIFPHPEVSSAPALSTDLLAIVVAVVAFLMSGIFLLTLVPDHSRLPVLTAALPPQPPSKTHQEPVAVSAATEPLSPGGTGIGQGTVAPLGGAGTPPRRAARHLPVEQDGNTHFVAVENIVAVHANSHYTYVFDGSAKLFCPLAISDVEQRLDPNRFVRVHRSHIVNVDHVAGLKRSGDNGLIELVGNGGYTIPVSRGRLGHLKARFNPRFEATSSS